MRAASLLPFPAPAPGRFSPRTLAALLAWLLLSPALSSPCRAQAPDTGQTAVHLGLLAHYGYIIPHSRTVRDMAGSFPRVIEADLSFHFTGAKAWQYLKAYPRLGAALQYAHFDNPRVLGNAYSLLLYAEPFLAAHRHFSLSFRLGTGLAYLDNIYDAKTNPQNQFFSARISFPLVANLMANYRISPRWLARAGLSYNHISNGGLRQPNQGINYPTVSAGLDYALRPARFPAYPAAAYATETKKQDVLLALLFSYPDRSDDPSRKAPLLGLTAYGSRRVGRLSALTAGAEWVANYAMRPGLGQQNGPAAFQRGALLAGHEWRIGRIRFSQALGFYVYAPYRARDPVYQRYGLDYHSARRLFFGVNLKAHREEADFLDARVGLVLGRR